MEENKKHLELYDEYTIEDWRNSIQNNNDLNIYPSVYTQRMQSGNAIDYYFCTDVPYKAIGNDLSVLRVQSVYEVREEEAEAEGLLKMVKSFHKRVNTAMEGLGSWLDFLEDTKIEE